MAIYRLLQNAPLMPEDVQRLQEAYEQTLQALDLARSDPLTEVIAKKIIAIGQTGVKDPSMIALLAIQIVVLPWLTLAIGAVLIGLLFRPWLGGPVPRHPFIGALLAVGVHVGVGVSATVLGLLL